MSALVLDTHVALWWSFLPEKLSPAAAKGLAETETLVFPAVVFWETALLVRKRLHRGDSTARAGAARDEGRPDSGGERSEDNLVNLPVAVRCRAATTACSPCCAVCSVPRTARGSRIAGRFHIDGDFIGQLCRRSQRVLAHA